MNQTKDKNVHGSAENNCIIFQFVPSFPQFSDRDTNIAVAQVYIWAVIQMIIDYEFMTYNNIETL